MTTPLTKPLKRELQIQGRPFVVTLSPEGIKLTLKGKRKGQELLWEDLVSGEAALAVALNASLKGIPAPSGAAAPAQGGTELDARSIPPETSTAGSGKETNVSNSSSRPSPTRTAKRKSSARPKRARSGRRP